MAWKRQTKWEEILRKNQTQGWGYKPFLVEDIILIPGVLPTDKVEIDIMEGWNEENSSNPGYTHLVVSRQREYTDAEQQEFEEGMHQKSMKDKSERYQQYLKLKGEFGDGAFNL